MASKEETNILSRDGSKEKLIDPESPKQSYGSNEQSRSSSTADTGKQQLQQEASPPLVPNPSAAAAAEVDRIEQLSDSSEPRRKTPEESTEQETESTTVVDVEPAPKLGFSVDWRSMVAFVIGFLCVTLRLVVYSSKSAFYEVIVLGVTLMLCSLVSCMIPRGLYARDPPEKVEPSARKKFREVSPTMPDDFPMEPRPEVSSPDEPSTEQVHHADVHHPDLPSSPSTSSAAKGAEPQESEPVSTSSGDQGAAATPGSPTSKTEAPGSSLEESDQVIEKDSKGSIGN